MMFPKPASARARRSRRRSDRAAHVGRVRALVFARERNTCRAWYDGHRFAWCQKVATDLHEIRTRGAVGSVLQAVTPENAIALCYACHARRHSFGNYLAISGSGEGQVHFEVRRYRVA